MNIDVSFSPYIIMLTAVLPALLSVYFAKKQKRSIIMNGLVTFILGLTWIGGWLYLGGMILFNPKKLNLKQLDSQGNS